MRMSRLASRITVWSEGEIFVRIVVLAIAQEREVAKMNSFRTFKGTITKISVNWNALYLNRWCIHSRHKPYFKNRIDFHRSKTVHQQQIGKLENRRAFLFHVTCMFAVLFFTVLFLGHIPFNFIRQRLHCFNVYFSVAKIGLVFF